MNFTLPVGGIEANVHAVQDSVNEIGTLRQTLGTDDLAFIGGCEQVAASSDVDSFHQVFTRRTKLS